ncbi:MAG: hypothetical protein RLZZ77_1405 [Bacteroidota bacterium]
MYTKSTGKATFTYPEVNYDQLFPFHLVMDEQRNLLHFGPSLKKLMGDSNYKKFDDLFKLERPDCDLDLFFNDDHFPTQLSIIQSKLPNKLTLTGSFTALPGKEGHLFLCTPWFKSPEEMNQLGLSITDYPSFDTSVSQLHLLRAQESANKDISTLFKRLSSQKEELELLSMIVQKAANAIIILNSHSVIEYANPALSNLLGFAPEEVTGKPIQEIIAENKSDHELGVALKSVLEGHSSLVETQLSTKLGTALWVNIQIQPLLGYTGIVEKYYLMIENVTTSHAARELLRESEAQLKLAVEGSGEGIWSLNLTTGDFKVSHQFNHLIGLPETTKLSPEAVIELIHEQDKERTLKQLQSLIDDKTDTFFCEFRVLQNNEVTKHFQMKGRKIKSIFDGSTQIAGTLADISVQKELEEELKISAKRFFTLLSNMNTGVLMEDQHRHIVLLNQAACDMFGFPVRAEDLIGADCSQMADQSKHLFTNPEQFVSRINEILANKTTVLSEELYLLSGHIIERDYIPLFNEGAYRGHFWQYRDITTRKNSEELLRNNEEKYRNIIENMHLGLLEVDLNETIQYANDSFCEMSGFSSEELIGSCTLNLFPVNAEDLVKEKQYLRARGILDTYEIQVKNRKNESRWWLISGAPMYDQNGNQTGSIGIHLDISEQKKLQDQLMIAKMRAEESNVAKDKFLANISHELRTPVNGIIGMSRNLARTSLLPEQKKYLHMLRSATDQLLIMLNDILDLAKIDAGKIHLDYRSFNLPAAIYKSIDVVQSRAEEKGLSLRIQMDDSLSMVYVGEEKRLRQILINILSNAVKFTEKGYVQITCSKVSSSGKRDQILIEITDTGIGMDDEFKKRLFQKFAQEDENSSRHYGGTGLGLSISRELIELMGGKIEVNSTKNKGTTVSLLIPFDIGRPEELIPEETEHIDTTILNNSKILLVEDNDLNQMVVSIALEHYGAYISCVFSGKDALERMEQQEFDLILMDIQMPGMDGYETASLIRQKYGTEIPIVALSANVLKGEAEKSFVAGMNDFIAKPFEEEQLIQKVVQQLTNRAAQRLQKAQSGATHNAIEYDLTYLEKSSHNNVVFFRKMLDVFINQGANTANELKEALENNDAKMVADLAHKVKPGLQHLKTGQIADQAMWLEKCIKAGAQIDEVRNETVRFIENLERLVDQMNKDKETMS